MQNNNEHFIPTENCILECVDSFMLNKLQPKAPIDVVILVSASVRVDTHFIRHHLDTFRGINKHFNYKVERVSADNQKALTDYLLESALLLVLVESDENYRSGWTNIVKAIFTSKGSKFEVILERAKGKGAFIL